jgi:hypothetical protein
MAKFNFDLTKYDSEFYEAALDRIESAAMVIRHKAINNLGRSIAAASGTKTPIVEYVDKKGKKRKTSPSQAGERWKERPASGPIYTERMHGEMLDTIRVVRSKNPLDKNILVMAGQYKTWWALQIEYGHAGWKGGAKPFFRPALAESMGEVIAICESGGGPKAVK